MARETEREAYARLHAKYGGNTGGTSRRRRAEPEPDDDDAQGDDGIFVLAGKHADSFMTRMFGDAPPAGKHRDDDEEDDDEEDDDEEDDAGDPPPSRQGPRFFGGRTQRG